MVTSAAIGITDGQRHFQWEGSHLLKLTEKGTGTHRTRALFRRDVKETRGAGTLEYDADVSYTTNQRWAWSSSTEFDGMPPWPFPFASSLMSMCSS